MICERPQSYELLNPSDKKVKKNVRKKFYRAITIGSIGVASDPSLEKTQYLLIGSCSKNTGSGSELLYENYDWVLGSKYVQI